MTFFSPNTSAGVKKPKNTVFFDFELTHSNRCLDDRIGKKNAQIIMPNFDDMLS